MLKTFFFFLLSLLSTRTTNANVVNITINATHYKNVVLKQYLSADIDWWPANTSESGGGWGDAGLLSLDLSNKRLQNMVAHLSPGILRVGGSLDNFVKYRVGSMSEEQCKEKIMFREKGWELCLNMTRWDEFNEFARNAGLDVVFGLSYGQIQDGSWDYENPTALLNYSKQKNYTFFGFELGEEMNPNPETVQFQNLLSGYTKLRKTLKTLWPNQTPRVIGPCVGMTYENVKNKKQFQFMSEFINASVVDTLCLHSYNNDGGDNWQKPGFLNQTLKQAKGVLKALRNKSSNTPLWCGECGPHNDGGVANVTDRFISSFWYADALGHLASLGLEQFGRQSLVGSNYGLLEMDTFLPNPDFYIAVLWKKLMGTNVLNLEYNNNNDQFHAYAHTHPTKKGKVGVLVVNPTNQTYKVRFFGEILEEYHLSSPSSIYSKDVYLNGKLCKFDEKTNNLPLLKPKVNSHSSNIVFVGNYSVVFLVVSPN